MTEVALDVAVDPAPVAPEASFVEALVQRVCAEFGAAAEEVRALAHEVLRGFTNARIHAFVPILVEKRLREHYRLRESAGRTA
jgi:hypothetical protein